MGRKHSSKETSKAAWAEEGDRQLRRLLEDEQLRSTLLGAYTTARSAYGRLSNGEGPKALLEDRGLQQELLQVAGAVREATEALKEPEPEKPRRRRHRGRSLLLLLAAVTLALVLSEDLRSKVLDMMFGAEEEFDYTSTTVPPTPAPAGVPGD